ncbi:hypothetical protein SNEBB_007745 [Seison nebaliae]|nr:hypothetical protein SNEBB_007745 [Seison nebaliae]
MSSGNMNALIENGGKNLKTDTPRTALSFLPVSMRNSILGITCSEEKEVREEEKSIVQHQIDTTIPVIHSPKPSSTIGHMTMSTAPVPTNNIPTAALKMIPVEEDLFSFDYSTSHSIKLLKDLSQQHLPEGGREHLTNHLLSQERHRAEFHEQQQRQIQEYLEKQERKQDEQKRKYEEQESDEELNDEELMERRKHQEKSIQDGLTIQQEYYDEHPDVVEHKQFLHNQNQRRIEETEMRKNNSEKIEMKYKTEQISPPKKEWTRDEILADMIQRKDSSDSELMRENKKLRDVISAYSDRLQLQIKVNDDLKNMLVAAVTGDADYEIERLCKDRARMGLEIHSLNERISELHDEIGRCNIHSDLWRSKYFACRQLLDEIEAQKSIIGICYEENNRTLSDLALEISNIRGSTKEIAYDIWQVLRMAESVNDTHVRNRKKESREEIETSVELGGNPNCDNCVGTLFDVLDRSKKITHHLTSEMRLIYLEDMKRKTNNDPLAMLRAENDLQIFHMSIDDNFLSPAEERMAHLAEIREEVKKIVYHSTVHNMPYEKILLQEENQEKERNQTTVVNCRNISKPIENGKIKKSNATENTTNDEQKEIRRYSYFSALDNILNIFSKANCISSNNVIMSRLKDRSNYPPKKPEKNEVSEILKISDRQTEIVKESSKEKDEEDKKPKNLDVLKSETERILEYCLKQIKNNRQGVMLKESHMRSNGAPRNIQPSSDIVFRCCSKCRGKVLVL